MRYFILLILGSTILVCCTQSSGSKKNPDTGNATIGFTIKEIWADDVRITSTFDSSIYVFSEKYLDINLNSTPSNDFISSDRLKDSSLDDPSFRRIEIVDENSLLTKRFASSTSFKNFVDKQGYKVDSESKIKYGFSYNLIRKQ